MLIYNPKHPIYYSSLRHFIEMFEYQYLHFYNENNNEETNILPKTHPHYSFLKKFNFLVENIKINDLNTLSKEIVILLSYLPFHSFCSIINYWDEKFPGISFHYVIEARHYFFKEKEQSLLNSSYNIFLMRLYILQETKNLECIYSPMRNRLIAGVLNDDKHLIEQATHSHLDLEDWNCLTWAYSNEKLWKENIENTLNEYSLIFLTNKTKFINLINNYLYIQNTHLKFDSLNINNLLNNILTHSH